MGLSNPMPLIRLLLMECLVSGVTERGGAKAESYLAVVGLGPVNRLRSRLVDARRSAIGRKGGGKREKREGEEGRRGIEKKIDVTDGVVNGRAEIAPQAKLQLLNDQNSLVSLTVVHTCSLSAREAWMRRGVGSGPGSRSRSQFQGWESERPNEVRIIEGTRERGSHEVWAVVR
ncbi:hypothetical protein LX32DRAFT_431283 [Colletotrichum zoysiae]|uniref:Uncharacterized protein n=1 Tax=Colletotrichum zoysiae TaxID=1216348 RepID=A0AAD9M3V4_9PEZI|nr:hypothetical protein LX32DRAFT_431283 [Colletotrichum zoysiae]